MNQAKHYPVLFGNSLDVPVDVRYIDYVLIARTNKKWNDFGFKFRVQMKFVCNSQKKEPLCLDAFVIPFLDKEIISDLDKWIDHLPTDIAKSYSILDSQKAYRDLKRWCGDEEEFLARLSTLRDLIVARQSNESSNDETLARLLRSSEFRLGVMRSPSAYLAYNRAGRILYTQSTNLVADARHSFRFLATLPGFYLKPHDLQITFDDAQTPLLDDRVHALIGVNGSGKSTLLRELIIELSKVRNGKNEKVFTDAFIDNSNARSKKSEFISECKCNCVMVFSSDSLDSFPSGVKPDSPFEYLYFNLIKKQNLGAASLSRMLVDIIRMNELMAGKTRYQILKHALQDYVDTDRILLPLKESANVQSHYLAGNHYGRQWVDVSTIRIVGEQKLLEFSADVDDRELPLITDKNGSEISLSSGQRVYLTFALQCLSFIDVGSLLIFDEPETHLHPNLISNFMELLHQLIEATQSIALIATHSAYVVRELPKQCVHVHEVKEEYVEISPPRLQTIGASVDSISQFVFNDNSVKKFYQKLAKRIAENNSTLDDVIDIYHNQLNTEMLIEVRNVMDGSKKIDKN